MRSISAVTLTAAHAFNRSASGTLLFSNVDARAPPCTLILCASSGRKSKMAELEDVTLDGKPLNSLRVADLKTALEKRGLPKSGAKNALIKRLKGVSLVTMLCFRKKSSSRSLVGDRPSISWHMREAFA